MMSKNESVSKDRRGFIKSAAMAGLGVSIFNFHILKAAIPKGEIIGHGDFKYQIDRVWGDLNPAKVPVINCHEMVQDQSGRLIMVTDHPKNNVIIYDKSGKLLNTWTLNFEGAHGLTIHDEGGEEFLYITDFITGTVVKCTLKGRVVLTLPHPRSFGLYEDCAPYRPTETAIGPNGDIYVADGYGSQYMLQFDREGNFIRKFGGSGFRDKRMFKEAHGITLDTRDSSNPTLLCTARIKNTFKRYSLDGQYLEDIYLPGAFVSRAVIDDDMLYSGVCYSMTADNYNMHENKGFVTILNGDNKVVSNPGGTRPEYDKNGRLQLMQQSEPIFKHCHDVCVDEDKNLYVCQWNANNVYPYKLHRV